MHVMIHEKTHHRMFVLTLEGIENAMKELAR